MSGLLAFHYSTPQKNFHRGCNLSCYPRGQARLSTGLATAVNRALLSVKLKATMHKRCLEESIGGGPRHEHEVVWIRPASSGFCTQNMKTGLRPWFCVPIQQKEPRHCCLSTQFLLCRGNRWVKEFVKIMQNLLRWTEVIVEFSLGRKLTSYYTISSWRLSHQLLWKTFKSTS